MEVILAMLVIVDDSLLYILLGIGLAGVGVSGVLGILLLKCPSAARAVISAWLSHRILTIEATLDRGYKFIPRKALPGGQLVANVDGKKSVKVIASNPEPSLACPCHLDGSGVKAVLAFEPSTVAVTPSYAAVMQVAETKELPVALGVWGEHVNLQSEPDKPSEPLVQKDSSGKLFVLDLGKIAKFFPFAYREDSYRNMLENEWQDGYRNRRQGKVNMKFVGVAVAFVVVAVIIGFLVTSGVIK